MPNTYVTAEEVAGRVRPGQVEAKDQPYDRASSHHVPDPIGRIVASLF